MNTTTVPAEIHAFATAVRAALADLPADEIDELTDGLEADLTEAFTEDLQRELPDPAAYAAELRVAAGLPSRAPKRSRVRDLSSAVADLGHDVDRNLRRSPIVARSLDFLITLRPAWWIVRGWAAYQVAGAFFGFEGDLLPFSGFTWFVLAAMVVGSVAVGLRHWPGWMRVLIAAGNVVAVVATVSGLSQVPSHADVTEAWNSADPGYSDDGSGYAPGDGVYSGGSEVTNIFAYDAAGKLLSGVQLFDQDGKPIRTSTPGGNGCLTWGPDGYDGPCEKPGAWLPETLATGVLAWNVYPMRMAESTEEDPTTPIPGAVAQDRPAPFPTVPALQRPAQPRQQAAPAEKTP